MSDPVVKPLVLVISGAGFTGKSILDGLAKAGGFRLAITVRPGSLQKPEVEEVRQLGVEIRACDWQTAEPAELDRTFSGADIVISAVHGGTVSEQTVLVDAAKRAKVKRFIPADFGPACVPGVREMFDQKLKIQRYVQDSGLPYTFIDVGFWMQITFPFRNSIPGVLPARLREYHGSGEVKTAVINKDHIGNFVARIVADPRTLNQYVFACEDEVTLHELFDIASEASGEDLHATAKPVDEAEVNRRIVAARGRYLESKDKEGIHEAWWYEYMRSIYHAGHNNSAHAKSQGALIAKELYPDVKCQTVAEYAKVFYALAESATKPLSWE